MIEGTTLRRYYPVFLVVAVFAAYLNGLQGAFVFDDCLGIATDPKVRSFPGAILNSSRPLVHLSFYFNYLLDGIQPATCRVINIAIHALAALALLGTLNRATGAAAATAGRMPLTRELAFLTALLWAVHPLQTESVTYVSQRAESMAGLFSLATIYCFVRGVTPRGFAHRWHTLAAVFCALAMATKPIAVVTPILVLLVHRTFFADSVRGAIRAYWRSYAALASTWIVLVAILVSPHESAHSAGFAEGAPDAWSYFVVEQRVTLHYLRLAFWPHPLCLDYMWLPAGSIAGAMIPCLITAALFATCLWRFSRGSLAGMGGLWFFIALAPSSSFIPVADPAAEHRMYLPLAGVLLSACLAAATAARRLASGPRVGAALGVLAAAMLATGTIVRNADYASLERLLQTTVHAAPDNLRARVSVISSMLAREDWPAAEAEARTALERIIPARRAPLTPREERLAEIASYYHATVLNQLGRSVLAQGRFAEAAKEFQTAVAVDPADPVTYYNLAVAQMMMNARQDAIANLEKALGLGPNYERARTLLKDLKERPPDSGATPTNSPSN